MMEPVDRGRRGPGLALVVLVFAAVVGAGVMGRLAEGTTPGPPPAATFEPPPSSPAPAVSPRASSGAGFVSFTCPSPSPSVVQPVPAEPMAAAQPGLLSTVAPSSAWLDLVSVDQAVWVLARGRLVRLDPLTGQAVGSWSYSDSPVFAADGIAPGGPGGGLWTWGPTGLRRFDGRSFVDVLPVPTAGAIGGLVDAGDGGVWVDAPDESSPGFALYRWSSGAWTRSRPCDDPAAPDGGWPGTSQASLAVDPTGRIVAVDMVGTSVRIRRFDGRDWTAVVGMRALGDPQAQPRVAIDAAGVVYVATRRALGRFDGSSWRSVPMGASRVTIVGDGSVAVAVSTPLGDTEVRRLDSLTLRPLLGEAPVLFTGDVTGLAPVPGGLAVAAPAAIGTGLAFVGFRGPGRPPTVSAVAADVPWLKGARDRPGPPLLAVSRGEAWFGSWEGIAWHFVHGKLTPSDVSGGAASTIRTIARTRDGSVWIGHDADLTIVRPSGATVEVAVDAVSIAPSADGSAWLLGSDGAVLVGALARSGAVVRGVARPPFDWGARIVADRDGSAWALGGSVSGPGLLVVHLVSGQWSVVPPPAGAAIVMIAGDPDGGIWGLASRPDGIVLVRDQGQGWRSAGEVPMLAATDLAGGPRGIVWITGGSLVRTDGAGRWETVAGSGAEAISPIEAPVGVRGFAPPPIPRFSAPSVAPDGTLYVACPSGICRLVGL